LRHAFRPAQIDHDCQEYLDEQNPSAVKTASVGIVSVRPPSLSPTADRPLPPGSALRLRRILPTSPVPAHLRSSSACHVPPPGHARISRHPPARVSTRPCVIKAQHHVADATPLTLTLLWTLVSPWLLATWLADAAGACRRAPYRGQPGQHTQLGHSVAPALSRCVARHRGSGGAMPQRSFTHGQARTPAI
jgi:hypothetical protein